MGQKPWKSTQKDRFDILLGKKIDKKGIGYNSYQSELTISSGGFTGKGFLKGDLTLKVIFNKCLFLFLYFWIRIAEAAALIF